MKLRIKVKTNQPKTEVVEKGEIWKINVNAKPENNKANEEIVKFFTRMFKKNVELVRGLKSRNKILEIS